MQASRLIFSAGSAGGGGGQHRRKTRNLGPRNSSPFFTVSRKRALLFHRIGVYRPLMLYMGTMSSQDRILGTRICAVS